MLTSFLEALSQSPRPAPSRDTALSPRDLRSTGNPRSFAEELGSGGASVATTAPAPTDSATAPNATASSPVANTHVEKVGRIDAQESPDDAQRNVTDAADPTAENLPTSDDDTSKPDESGSKSQSARGDGRAGDGGGAESSPSSGEPASDHSQPGPPSDSKSSEVRAGQPGSSSGDTDESGRAESRTAAVALPSEAKATTSERTRDDGQRVEGESIRSNTRPRSEGKSDANTDDGESRRDRSPSAPLSHKSASAPAESSSANQSSTNSSFLNLLSGRSAAPMAEAAAKSAPPPPTPMAATPNEGFSPQVVRSVLAMSRAGGGAMNIKLQPEALGALRIQMTMVQGRMSVRFQSDTAEARQLLSQNLDALRRTLEGQGLRTERISVEPLTRNPMPASSNSQAGDHNAGADSNRRETGARQDASDGRSRGFTEQEQRRQPRQEQGSTRFDEHVAAESFSRQRVDAGTTTGRNTETGAQS